MATIYTVTSSFLRRILRKNSLPRDTPSNRELSLSLSSDDDPPLPLETTESLSAYSKSKSQAQAQHLIDSDPLMTCQICGEPHLHPRADGTTEIPAMLPCGHIFGTLCIAQWLEISSRNKDCPQCRRSMRYRGCGCGVKAIPVELPPGPLPITLPIPKMVKEADMPAKCWVCRCVESASSGGSTGIMADKLRLMQERMAVEVRTLEALKLLETRSYFGGGGTQDGNFGARLAESRGHWRSEMDRLNLVMMQEARTW